MGRTLLSAVLATALVGAGFSLAPSAAIAKTTTQHQTVDAAVVKVQGRPVAVLAPIGGMSAQQRANLLENRLRDRLTPDPQGNLKRIEVSEISVSNVNGVPMIVVRGDNLITVTNADAKLIGMTPQAAAERWANNLKATLPSVRLGQNNELAPDAVAVFPIRVAQPIALAALHPLMGTQQAVQGNQIRFATVNIKGKEVLRLTESGDRTAEQRAQTVRERVNIALKPAQDEQLKQVKESDITVETVGNMPVIRLQGANIVAVTDDDAKLQGTNAQELAQRWASDLRASLSGVQVKQGQEVPTTLVTITTGTMARPAGGGAGTTPKQK